MLTRSVLSDNSLRAAATAPAPVPMTESELAEGAYHAQEALQLDLTDPAAVAQADQTVRAASSGLFEATYDVAAVKRFLAALRGAAKQRGVPPHELWSALDSLERM